MAQAVLSSTSRSRIPVVNFTTPPRRGEKRVLFDGMVWEDYEMLGKAAERWGGARVAYLDGVIELMFPSFDHESRRWLLGWLLASYLVEQGVKFFPHGSTTLKRELRRAGKEPDESYCFHRQKKIPDLVIEVATTSGGLDTLEIYRRWSIPEVWIWQRERLHAFVLQGDAYVKSTVSRWFPDLDLALLAECAKIEESLEARKKFLGGRRQ